ncbi:MAG: DUF418 domain-containing protein [Holophaga sp.]|nr:DUF418 domain-containing protein [Holophaga sp.]
MLGLNDGAFQFASGLMMLGNLSASMGYVSVIILMLHSDTVFSKVRILAPAGRMVLTNYLIQPWLCGVVLFGCGAPSPIGKFRRLEGNRFDPFLSVSIGMHRWPKIFSVARSNLVPRINILPKVDTDESLPDVIARRGLARQRTSTASRQSLQDFSIG